MTTNTVNRRSFLNVSAAAGGGIIIAMYTDAFAVLLAQGRQGGAPPPPLEPSAFITISKGGIVTITAKNPEIGRREDDVLMLIAEELTWTGKMRIVQSDEQREFTAVNQPAAAPRRRRTTPMRQLGAAARAPVARQRPRERADTELTTASGGSCTRHRSARRYTASHGEGRDMPSRALAWALKDPRPSRSSARTRRVSITRRSPRKAPSART